jgi:glycosyltransferase involved in cell wall biosynthesis
MLSRDYNKPLVVTIRGTDMDITAKRSNICFKLLNEVVTTSKSVISPSPRLNSILHKDFGVISKAICNGIDVDEICHINDNTLAQNYNGHTVLLSVSRLIHSKGIDLNLKAIQTLIQKHSNLLYVIVGDGPARKELEQLVYKLYLGRFVKFMGTLPHSEAMKFMSICDIFTMPSWQETFGLVYLEAMAFGKPVIGCKGQGMDNIISEGKVGLLAEQKDWHSVANALDFLFSNPEEGRMMGERGRKLALENFTHKKNAEQTLSLYNTVLKNV